MIANVKDGGFKLNTMTIVFKSIVSCDFFGLEESFHGTCFGHALFKACQCVATNEKVCKGLKFVSYIKALQFGLHKCITWLKTILKCKKCNKAYSNSNLLQSKLNTPMKIR